MFNFYARQEEVETDKNRVSGARLMSYKSYLQLLTHFKITPVLVTAEDSATLYKHLSRSMGDEGAERMNALTFADFTEVLVRLAILAKGSFIPTSEAPVDSIDKKVQLPIKSYDVTGLNVDLVEKLLLYMKLPQAATKIELDRFLNEVRADQTRVLPLRKLKTLAKRTFTFCY